MVGAKHNSMIGEEIAGMRQEIGQARELLLDAIGKLCAGFSGVTRAVRETGLAPVASARIDREVSSIVTALQFQDLLDQILGQTLRRLDAIEAGLGIAVKPGSASKGKGAPRAKRVTQRSVDPGDVELF